MANHASALKAHRQGVARATRNRGNKSALRTALKKFATQIKDGKVEEARKGLSELYAAVDKAARKKAVSPNAAARQKSRLTKRLNRAVTDSAPKA
jgi:small subunit ribosomal protein S20